MEQLINEITHCENIRKVLEENCTDCPCSEIIKSQNINIEDFQVPEPWNGDLVNCKILFISSNPSFNPNDLYPKNNWDDNRTYDFFVNRFSSTENWVTNKLQTKQLDGSLSNGIVFWRNIKSYAQKLLDKKNPIIGTDYAMTEIVHCKSTNEKGVIKATNTCVEKYLDRVLNLTQAKVLICLGAKAEYIIKNKFNIDKDVKTQNRPNSEQIFVFLPHPTSRKVRRLEKLFNSDTIDFIKGRI